MDPQSTSSYEVPVPKDFTPPPNAGADSFDIVCTARLKEGKICFLKIGNSDTGYGKGEGEKQETKPDYSNMAQDMMSQSPAGASPSY